MNFTKILGALVDETKKSDITHKHACVAMNGRKQISPTFHNYMRYSVRGSVCGSSHAEMSTINYLLGSSCGERRCEKQQCIL